MSKKLLLGLALLLTATFASAQALQLPARNLAKKSSKASSEQVMGMMPFKAQGSQKMWLNKADAQKVQVAAPSASSVRKGPRKAEEATARTWFYYPMNSQGSCYVVGFDALASMFGSYMTGQTVYNVYSEIPSNYAGAVADTLDILFYDASKIKDSVYIYFQGLNDATGETYKEYAISASEVKGLSGGYLQWTTIPLPETYTIPVGGCRVGYAFEAEEGARPIVSFDNYDDYGTLSGSYYYTFNYTDGNRYYDDFNAYGLGSLTTSVALDVSNCTAKNVSVESIGEQTTLANSETEIGGYVDNDGLYEISNISYILTVDGVAQAEKTYTFDEAVSGGSYGYVPFGTATFDEGTHEVSVTITKADGEDNTSDEKTADDGLYIALEKSADRKSVVEEITSTSCGYCPRGAVALKKLKEAGVITLASHWNYSYVDPMTVEDNYDFVNFAASAVGGFPGALFDRCVAGDPYFGLTDGSYGFVADQYCEAIKAQIPSEATVSLTADWADEAKTQVTVSTDCVFGYDRMDAAYAIAYILSEDDMAGTDSTWLQLNYYSGYSTWSQFDGMSDWVNADEYVSTSYNDVVVGVWGSYAGLEGTVSPFITKDEVANDSRVLNIASNTLIQDKDKLKLTALLINQNNGCIVNAAQVEINGVSGINGVSSDNSNVKEVARYNANGQLLTAPQKGLNIVKMSDGKSVKVMVK